jgi:hypothetical protein
MGEDAAAAPKLFLLRKDYGKLIAAFRGDERSVQYLATFAGAKGDDPSALVFPPQN